MKRLYRPRVKQGAKLRMLAQARTATIGQAADLRQFLGYKVPVPLLTHKGQVKETQLEPEPRTQVERPKLKFINDLLDLDILIVMLILRRQSRLSELATT